MFEVTEKHRFKRIGIFIDREFWIAPEILFSISDGIMVISGEFPDEKVQAIANKIYGTNNNWGNLSHVQHNIVADQEDFENARSLIQRAEAIIKEFVHQVNQSEDAESMAKAIVTMNRQVESFLYDAERVGKLYPGFFYSVIERQDTPPELADALERAQNAYAKLDKDKLDSYKSNQIVAQVWKAKEEIFEKIKFLTKVLARWAQDIDELDTLGMEAPLIEHLVRSWVLQRDDFVNLPGDYKDVQEILSRIINHIEKFSRDLQMADNEKKYTEAYLDITENLKKLSFEIVTVLVKNPDIELLITNKGIKPDPLQIQCNVISGQLERVNRQRMERDSQFEGLNQARRELFDTLDQWRAISWRVRDWENVRKFSQETPRGRLGR